MEPNVTLHWFVHPNWFQELGGFTKAENVDIFVEWCRSAFSLFGAFSCFPVNPEPWLDKQPPSPLCLSSLFPAMCLC